MWAASQAESSVFQAGVASGVDWVDCGAGLLAGGAGEISAGGVPDGRGGGLEMGAVAAAAGALVVTASGFFTEIEDALNVIWKAPRHESYFYQLVRGRVRPPSLGSEVTSGRFALRQALTAAQAAQRERACTRSTRSEAMMR